MNGKNWTIAHQALATLLIRYKLKKWQLARILGLQPSKMRDWLPDPDGPKTPETIPPARAEHILRIRALDVRTGKRTLELRSDQIAIILARPPQDSPEPKERNDGHSGS